jgi:hypothetical protein
MDVYDSEPVRPRPVQPQQRRYVYVDGTRTGSTLVPRWATAILVGLIMFWVLYGLTANNQTEETRVEVRVTCQQKVVTSAGSICP